MLTPSTGYTHTQALLVFGRLKPPRALLALHSPTLIHTRTHTHVHPRPRDSVSECLAFMDAHPSYQDAATYRAKYFQLQVRSTYHYDTCLIQELPRAHMYLIDMLSTDVWLRSAICSCLQYLPLPFVSAADARAQTNAQQGQRRHQHTSMQYENDFNSSLPRCTAYVPTGFW